MSDKPNMDKIIARIRKCLALSASPEPHEAAAALRQAQKLMEQYGISEDQVRMADVQEKTTTAGRSAHRPPAWLVALADTVANAFGVSQHYHDRVNRSCEFVFVGVGPAPEVAGYTFTVLRRKCSAARERHFRTLRGKRISRVRRADAFANGWVLAVRDSVRAFAQEVPKIVGQYLKECHPGLVDYKPVNREDDKDGMHRLAGFIAGRDVELHHGVAGKNQNLLRAE